MLFFALSSKKNSLQFWYNSYLSSIYAKLSRTCRCWFQTNRQVVASISQKGAMWFNHYGLTWTGRYRLCKITRSSLWSYFLLQTQVTVTGQTLSMGRRVAQSLFIGVSQGSVLLHYTVHCCFWSSYCFVIKNIRKSCQTKYSTQFVQALKHLLPCLLLRHFW